MRLVTTAALTAAALAATTGPALAVADTSAADKTAITKVITIADKPTDVAKSCAAYSPALLKTTFGSKKQCLISQTPSDPSDLPKSITVSSISVSGKKAKAKVTEHGGDNAKGTWQLTKSGGTWQVTLVGADFLRSGLKSQFGPKYSSGGAAEDPFDSKSYRACALAKFLDRSDKQFLAFFYEVASARNKIFGQVFNSCTAKAPGGKSPFRKVLEAALKQQGDAQGVPADLTSCVITKLRTAVSEPTLINALVDGVGSTGYNKFSQTISTVSNACNKGGAAGQVRAPKGIVRRTPIH
jgi:hypothetical protein